MASASSDFRPLSRDLLAELGGWTVMKEAQSLFQSGRVDFLSFDPPLLTARIRSGGQPLITRLKLGRSLSDFENLCTCRQAKEYGTICSHVVAGGLAYLAAQSPQSKPPAVTAPTSALTPPPPSLRLVKSDSADSQARQLSVAVLLPLSFADSWRRGDLRVILEGQIDNHPPQPWDSLPLSPDATWKVEESDYQLLRCLEAWHPGKIPGVFSLSAKQLTPFFETLKKHPRVSLGKKAPIQVHTSQLTSLLQIELLDSGEIRIPQINKMASTPHSETLESSGKQWLWFPIENRLEEMVSPSPVYRSLYAHEVVIPRAQVGSFLTKELPALHKTGSVQISDAIRKIEFRPYSPQFRGTLEGSLGGLSLKLEAVYPDHSILITSAHPAANGAFWIPDASNPFLYWTRHPEKEREALAEIIGAGFSRGERSPEHYHLSSEPRVAAFLANILPRWRRSWKLDFGSRMEALWERLDYIEPEISFESSGQDWLGVQLHLRSKNSSAAIAPAEVQRWLQTGKSFERTASDRIVLLPADSLKQYQEVLADCQVRQSASGPMQMPKRFASYFQGALESSGFSFASSFTPEAPKISVGELSPVLAQRLRPYQLQGVRWMQGLAQQGFSGILADEMGLGKTLQTLAFLEAFLRATPTGRALIVCPTSLVENWRQEAARFTPSLQTLVLHGHQRAKAFDQIPQVDLVITSYALLRRDLERYRDLEFKVVVLDEAQHIKNRSSLNAQSAKSLKADHRLVLTGTPLENSLLDLWSIFDFLMPGYLGTATDFRERYEIPISKHQDAAAQKRLHHRLRPFVLRRTKLQVAPELPPHLEQISYCELSEEQKEAYTAILEQGRKEVVGGESPTRRTAILSTLLRLRQVCCHLNLLPSDSPKEWREPSGKLDYFRELLDEAIDGGHRILVFSQFVEMLKILRASLDQSKIAYCYLDGSTRDRQGEVDRFQKNNDIPVFLISLKAGGTGLNLTAADMVIHFDPWWNPAVEDQATARAHRIGQSRMVNSYKLIASNTVEDKIVQLQAKKKNLIASNITEEQVFLESLSWDEIQSLLA